MISYKGYKISSVGDFALYQILVDGKGSLPKELRGHYTSIEVAKQFIDAVKEGRSVSATSGD